MAALEVVKDSSQKGWYLSAVLAKAQATVVEAEERWIAGRMLTTVRADHVEIASRC
jgi:hypothetical protein